MNINGAREMKKRAEIFEVVKQKKLMLLCCKKHTVTSLLCSDYKLLSKTLANRIAGVMDGVIHPDQTYCVPRRSIFDNVSLVRDVLDVSKQGRSHGCARVCRCHPQWQLAHLKTDAELLFF